MSGASTSGARVTAGDPRRPRNAAGFTLIELLIVVLVVGVIAAIAYPSYMDFVERSRRSEAIEALQDLAKRQEQFYNDNKAYAGSIGDLGIASTTANDYYNLSITTSDVVDGDVQGYTLNASAINEQASDTACATIRLDSDGNKTPADCW